MTELVLEGFAGCGGWSTGLRMAGFAGMSVGVEWDDAACRTAAAAGHLRVRADVAAFPLGHLAGKVDGAILSPPCQAWSNAGDQLGKLDQGRVLERIAAFARGETPPDREWADERSMLTAEPMRWARALVPRWIALEQVPPVLPLWQYTSAYLRALGYRTWTGVLSAEQYGVPQTRRRAILIARRDGLSVGPPEPTHQQYRTGRALLEEPDLFGDPLPPPVSMADALGWGLPDRPSWTVTAGGTETGGAEVFGNAKNRAHLRDVVMRNGNQANACERRACEPAGTLFFGQRTNAVDWVVRQTERQANGGNRSIEDPSLTITASLDNGNMRWAVSTGNNSRIGGGKTELYTRDLDAPAPTLTGNVNRWTATRPATTVCGDARIAPPGHRDREGGERQFGEETVRVTVQEAAVLQSFPADYPWQGNKSQQYRQVSDAVPPLLAAAILRPLIHPTAREVAA